MNKNTKKLKEGLAKMMKGGVIMDVVNRKQAKIAEDAGAVAVMALERVPSDIRAQGGVLIKGILKDTTIPVMAKIRIGHFVEAQVLQALEVDYIDESEVLTPADEEFHVNKKEFKVPFVCGATNLGEALRRINEGAAMIRTKGEAGTGNVVEAVRHWRLIHKQISELETATMHQLKKHALEMRVPLELVEQVKKLKRLPVVTFVAGGIATPADAAMMMQMGADGVFVGSGIFKSKNPAKYAKAIVKATMNYGYPKIVAEASEGIGDAMPGLEIDKLETKLAKRGW